MALTIEILIDDADIVEVVGQYNANASTPITVKDFEGNRKDEVTGILREFLYDNIIALIEDENEAVYDMFADTFEDIDSYDYDEFEDDLNINDQPDLTSN